MVILLTVVAGCGGISAAQARARGQRIAARLEAGWNQYRFQDEPIMATQLRSALRGQAAAVRSAAVQSAVAFARRLEAEQRLAPGSASQLERAA